MPDSYAAVGHVFMDKRSYLRQAVDAVADEEHLSVAAHLKVDGIGDDLMAVAGYLGVDGITVGRRRADDAHIARSHQRELQRAWNGRGTHGECVDIGLELAQFLFRGDTELLLLVDDEKSEVVPFHTLPYKLVGADKYVNLSILKVAEQIVRLLGRTSPGEIVHAHREVLEPVAESLVMLIGQYRRGTSTAVCLESQAALNAALMAASVLPNPTSRHRPAGPWVWGFPCRPSHPEWP